MPAASMMWVEARAVKVTGLCPRVGERTYGGRSDLPVSAALAALGEHSRFRASAWPPCVCRSGGLRLRRSQMRARLYARISAAFRAA
jgi:hypothetical protein